MSKIRFLLSAFVHFSLFLGAPLMPHVGKLQMNTSKKLSSWLMTLLCNKTRVTSTGGCTPNFNLIHFLPATIARLICFSVGRPEKGNLTAFPDGKGVEEMAAVAGIALRQQGERLGLETEGESHFCEPSSDYSDSVATRGRQ